jgi:hypothetical protein
MAMFGAGSSTRCTRKSILGNTTNDDLSMKTTATMRDLTYEIFKEIWETHIPHGRIICFEISVLVAEQNLPERYRLFSLHTAKQSQ